MRTLLIIPAYNEEGSLVSTIESLKASSFDGVNLGLAGAFQAGMKYAYRHHYDCAIQFDADGQHLPEYIPLLEKAVQENDIAIGSRFVSKKKPSSMRMFGSNLIEVAIKLTTGETIKDPTSGMRAFNGRMIEQMAKGLNFGPEPDTVSYLIKRADAKVVEVPVEMAERTAGESYLNLGNSAKYMLRMTVSILFMQVIRKRIGR